MRARAGKTSKGAKKSTKVSRTDRAGLKISVARVGRNMRRTAAGLRVSADSPVYVAGVLNYLVENVIYGVVDAEKGSKRRHRITADAINQSIRRDVDMNELLGTGLVSGARAAKGTLPKRTTRRKASKGKKTSE